MKFSVTILATAALLSVGLSAQAQFGATGLQQTVTLSATPVSPEPGQLVTFRANSFLFDIDAATIFWFVNETLRRSGVGVKTFQIEAADIGSPQTVRVVVESAQGRVDEAEKRIVPSSVSLIWEADTYTPPFYKGAARYTPGAALSIRAVPTLTDTSGRLLAASSLIYTWEVDGTVLGSRSGRGRDTLQFQGKRIGGSPRVSVSVSPPDGSVTARGDVLIPESSPLVLFYERSPLLGVQFNRGVANTFALEGQETVFEAYPFFFSVPHRGDTALRYRWSVGGRKVSLPENAEQSLTVRGGNEPGRTRVSLSVNHSDAILQFAASAFAVEFGFSGQRDSFAQ